MNELDKCIKNLATLLQVTPTAIKVLLKENNVQINNMLKNKSKREKYKHLGIQNYGKDLEQRLRSLDVDVKVNIDKTGTITNKEAIRAAMTTQRDVLRASLTDMSLIRKELHAKKTPIRVGVYRHIIELLITTDMDYQDIILSALKKDPKFRKNEVYNHSSKIRRAKALMEKYPGLPVEEYDTLFKSNTITGIPTDLIPKVAEYTR